MMSVMMYPMTSVIMLLRSLARIIPMTIFIKFLIRIVKMFISFCLNKFLRKKPFRICEGVEPHQFTDREIEDYPDIIDPFGRIDEINVRSEEDNGKEVSEDKDITTKKSTKITFG